jgi:hypothetical protein
VPRRLPRGRFGPRARTAARAVAVTATLLLALSAGASPASAWSNGPGGDGFGTHDWVLYEANRIASAQGHRWLDWTAAQPMTDDPDTKLHDTYHHVYDVTESPYGDSPKRVAQLYSEAVRQLKARDRAGASRTVGLLAHYYADTCNPLHTDQTPAEQGVHQDYESAVENETDGIGKNAAWVRARPFLRVTDPAAFTAQAAATANVSYARLVSEFDRAGFDPQVATITRSSLDLAANGLAAIIGSIQLDAGLAATSVKGAQAPSPSTPGAPAAAPAAAVDATSSASAGALSTESSVAAPEATEPAPATQSPVPSDTPPDAPSAPSPLVFLAVGALLALAAGVAVALLTRRR